MNKEVLNIDLKEIGETKILRLTGELDAYTSDQLTNIAKTWIRTARKVMVNLDDLEYIDSTGLSVLVWMWVETKDRGISLVLSCRNPRIHRILEITGLLSLFTIESVDEEVKAIPDVVAGKRMLNAIERTVKQSGAANHVSNRPH